MFRVANLLMVLALLATAAVVYQVKYASTADADRLARLRLAIRAERDAIAVMRAEWARRTAPLYVQGLVQRHLDLQPLNVDAISTLDDLPERPAHKPDGIGGMIEELVDTPLATSSISRSGTSASAPPASPGSGGAATLPASSALRVTPSHVPPKPAQSAPTAARTAPAPLRAAGPVPTAPSIPAYAPPAPSYAPPAAPPAAAPSSGGMSGLGPILPPVSLPGGR